MAKVSIIVPAYNREKYIGQCLDSLLNQTYKDLEIIVVDDASTDDTPQIVEEYRERHPDKIKIKKLERNSGPSVARNEGIKIAEGEYICFCDSDDWFPQERVEKLVHYMEENPQKVWVATNAWNFDEASGKIIGLRYDVSTESLSENAFIACLENRAKREFTGLIRALARREVFTLDLFDPALKGGEDDDIILRIAYRYPGGFFFINEPLYFYRIHKEQLTKNINYFNALPFYKKFSKLWSRNLSLPSEHKERYLLFRKLVLRGYANAILKEGHYKEATEFYKEILPDEPLPLRILYKLFILFPSFGKLFIKVYHWLKGIK